MWDYLGDVTINELDFVELGKRIKEFREMCGLSKETFLYHLFSSYGDAKRAEELEQIESGYGGSVECVDDLLDYIVAACVIRPEWLCYGEGRVLDYSRLLEKMHDYDWWEMHSYEWWANREYDEPFRAEVAVGNPELHDSNEFPCFVLAVLPVGERVRLVRLKHRLSVRAFSKRLGVSATAISNIECGNRGLSVTMAKTISNEYKVNEKWLRGGKGPIFATLEEKPKIEVPKMSADKLTRGMAEIVSDGVEKLSNTDLNNLIDSATFLLSITRRELDKREEKSK